MSQAILDGLLQVTSVAGMLIFITVFLGVAFWAATRSRGEVDNWSHLPLDEK